MPARADFSTILLANPSTATDNWPRGRRGHTGWGRGVRSAWGRRVRSAWSRRVRSTRGRRFRSTRGRRFRSTWPDHGFVGFCVGFCVGFVVVRNVGFVRGHGPSFSEEQGYLRGQDPHG